jgi:hypothetical protein
MFIELSTSTMAGITGTATGFIGDLMPLIVIVFGISIGLWVVDHFLFRR